MSNLESRSRKERAPTRVTKAMRALAELPSWFGPLGTATRLLEHKPAQGVLELEAALTELASRGFSSAEIDAAFCTLLSSGRIELTTDPNEICTIYSRSEYFNWLRERPDSSADNPPKIPNSPATCELAIHLARNTYTGKSKKQLAVEFMKGDESRAESELRTLRRHPDFCNRLGIGGQ